MNTYQIEVKIQITKVFEVCAESLEEAIESVSNDGELVSSVFDADDADIETEVSEAHY